MYFIITLNNYYITFNTLDLFNSYAFMKQIIRSSLSINWLVLSPQ